MNRIIKYVLLQTATFIVFQPTALGQAPPQSVQSVIYSSITSASTLDGSGYIDNRSTFSRHSDYFSYRATGTGTWSVDMQYADTTPTSWTSFGTSAQVNQANATSGIGFGFGYHDFYKFVFVGTATISNSFATKNAWFPVEGGFVSSISVTSPITTTGGATPTIACPTCQTLISSVSSAGQVIANIAGTVQGTSSLTVSGSDWTFAGNALLGTSGFLKGSASGWSIGTNINPTDILIQPLLADTNAGVYVRPSGIGTSAVFREINSSDLNNYAYLNHTINGANAFIRTAAVGSPANPVTFFGIGEASGSNLASIGFQFGGTSKAIISSAGKLTLSSILNAPLTTPASSGALCTQNDFEWDANFIYVCTSASNWKRVALSSF